MADVTGFKLIVEDDEGRRSVVPVDLGEVSIGRLDANTIRLDQRNVSRHHARILKHKEAIVAEDLDSYNGVYINGTRVDGKIEVHEGDVIRIGDFQLELRGAGLARRREETTQKTMIPQGVGRDESTRPDIRPDGPLSDATPTLPADSQGVGVATQHEATSIIRLSELTAPEVPQEGRSIAGEKPKLVCVSTQFAGREFVIRKTEVVIGRTEENDIAIDHRSVSRHHCKIVASGKRFLLVDMGSANGTLVNGEEYAQSELRSGDLLEIGHVRLRFVPPGESYRLSSEELEAVGSARKPKHAEIEATQADSGASSAKAPGQNLLYGAIALAAISIVAVSWMVLAGSGSSATAVAAMETSPNAAVDNDGGEVAKLIAKAKAALGERRWRQASVLGGAVLELESGNAVAKDIVRQAEKEEAAQGHYENANQAIQDGDWERAWNALQEVPNASVYHPQAQKLVEQVRGALITERITRGTRALEQEQWDKAEDLADEIDGLGNDNAEAAKMRSTAQEGRHKRSAAAQRRAAKPVVKKAHAPPAQAAPTPAAKPTPQKAPAPEASAAADPRAIFREGAKALQENNIPKAIETFNQCVRVDRRFGLCYRALGIAHAKAGDGERAAENYEKYLRVMPNAADREQVQQILEQYRGGK